MATKTRGHKGTLRTRKEEERRKVQGSISNKRKEELKQKSTPQRNAFLFMKRCLNFLHCAVAIHHSPLTLSTASYLQPVPLLRPYHGPHALRLPHNQWEPFYRH